MFVRVEKRDEHLQNMKKFEKRFDLHQIIFEQHRTLPNMKFIIEKGGQTDKHLQNMKDEHRSSSCSFTFGQGLGLEA